MTRGIKETHSKIIGGADDTGRKGVMPNVPVLGEVVFEADAAIGVGGDVSKGEFSTSIGTITAKNDGARVVKSIRYVGTSKTRGRGPGK